MSHYDDACMYYATPKQHLDLNSRKSWATLTLSWKKALLIKKACTSRIAERDN